MLLANHGALAIGPDLLTAYHRMETIEHFAKISLVTRTLGRENLLSREEVQRLQGLRGMYGIASPAPVCTDDTMLVGPGGQVECQVVQAPDGAAGCAPRRRYAGPAAPRLGARALAQAQWATTGKFG